MSTMAKFKLNRLGQTRADLRDLYLESAHLTQGSLFRMFSSLICLGSVLPPAPTIPAASGPVPVGATTAAVADGNNAPCIIRYPVVLSSKRTHKRANAIPLFHRV